MFPKDIGVLSPKIKPTLKMAIASNTVFTLLAKTETSSARVKSIAFHPIKPFIFTALHSGNVEMWDWRRGTLLHTFSEHKGPVRAIDCHPTEPFFVTGGDDKTIRIWNYQRRVCVKVIRGHGDYLRSVQFHPTKSWVVSSSDDRTVRIWEYQTGRHLLTLPGHVHYVMCAKFHPTQPVVASASLDRTVRLWDISTCGSDSFLASTANYFESHRLSNEIEKGFLHCEIMDHSHGVNTLDFSRDGKMLITGSDDMHVNVYQVNDQGSGCTRKWTLRGHDNNVSACIFSPHSELILSNSEDESIRVWSCVDGACRYVHKFPSSRFWCMAAHPNENVYAAGHDKGLIIFKLFRERPGYDVVDNQLYLLRRNTTTPQQYRSQTHKNEDSGKRQNEGAVSLCDLRNGTERVVFRPQVVNCDAPHSIHVNPYTGALLLTGYDATPSSDKVTAVSHGKFSRTKPISYEIASKDDGSRQKSGGWGRRNDQSSSDYVSSGSGSGVIDAVWYSRNNFTVLTVKKDLVVLNKDNKVVRTIKSSQYPALTHANHIFQVSPLNGSILLATDDEVLLFDLESTSHSASVKAAMVKEVAYSSNGQHIALISKHRIWICTSPGLPVTHTNSPLKLITTSFETTRIKSAAWHQTRPVLFVRTFNYLKYFLLNGQFGLVNTRNEPAYMMSVSDTNMIAVDSTGSLCREPIDSFDFTICDTLRADKEAAKGKSTEELAAVIREHSANAHVNTLALPHMLGESGNPGAALELVTDPLHRFNLAISAGQIDVAMECCLTINKKVFWERLAQAAIFHGNIVIAERALQKSFSFDKLILLYVVTGQLDKVKKMEGVCGKVGEKGLSVIGGLLTGGTNTTINTMRDNGLSELADYMKMLKEEKDEGSRLAQHQKKHEIAIPGAEDTTIAQPYQRSWKPELLQPPAVVGTVTGDWVMIDKKPSQKETKRKEEEKERKEAEKAPDATPEPNAWDDDDDVIVPEAEVQPSDEIEEESSEEEEPVQTVIDPSSVYSGELSLDALPHPIPIHTPFSLSSALSSLRSTGMTAATPDNAQLIRILRHELIASSAYLSSNASSSLNPCLVSVTSPDVSTSAVARAQSLRSARSQLHSAMTTGRFGDVVDLSKQLLVEVGADELHPTKPKNPSHGQRGRGRYNEDDDWDDDYGRAKKGLDEGSEEEAQKAEMIKDGREYFIAASVELKRRDLAKSGENPKRQAILSALLGHASLQPEHNILTMKQSMNSLFKAQEYNAAAYIAQKLRRLSPPQDVNKKAEQIIAYARQGLEKDQRPQFDKAEIKQNPDRATQGDYLASDTVAVCVIDFEPLRREEKIVRCSFCGASAHQNHSGTVCPVCSLAHLK
ncbi:Coatomer subunit alpha (CopA) [Blattamonas nauphoetae]|uniref:Coatomer subunit alpha (CopA) n=1 Tax=Blattamonas nauphoetae TaxID=2049346 RepID=A0ABQ9XM72_9EUKA|nr:Coatomer subunit alpha (CopA) [Blattamonas nauphoetae]